jgi:hypothetical protein
MEANRFFRFLWRINAIGIAGCIAIVGVVWADWTIGQYFRRHRVEITNLVEQQNHLSTTTVEYALSDGERLAGTDLMMFVLDRVTLTKHEGFSIKSRASLERDHVNVLLVSLRDASARWLFSGTEQDIHSIKQISGEVERGGESVAPTKSILLVATKRAVDGRLEKTQTVFVDRLAGGRAQVVAEEIDWMRTIEQVDPRTLLMIYETEGRTVASVLSTQTYMAATSKDVPKLAEPLSRERPHPGALKELLNGHPSQN